MLKGIPLMCELQARGACRLELRLQRAADLAGRRREPLAALAGPRDGRHLRAPL